VDAVRHAAHSNITLLTERAGARAFALEQICDSVDDHLLGIGDSVLSALGFPRAAVIAAERLPRSKKIRSGDLAEILATEFVKHHTEFEVPLRRLRHKDDREMSMRGDDIIALRREPGQPRVLKGEVKSRVSLTPSVVGEACASLDESHGRPKPQTLGFIAHQLRLTGRDVEAEAVEDLMQANLGAKDIAHLVFTMSENAPDTRLARHAKATSKVRDRRLVGLRVTGHQDFIRAVFDEMASRYRQPSDLTTAQPSIVTGPENGSSGTTTPADPTATTAVVPLPPNLNKDDAAIA
jgi:Cap4 SAVED domain